MRVQTKEHPIPSVPASAAARSHRAILAAALALAPLVWAASAAAAEDAPDPAAPAAAALGPAAAGADVPAKPGLLPPTESMWMLFGRLHILVVHFPIALLTVAALIEVLGILRRSQEVATGAPILLVLGALGALASVVKGWVHAGYGTYTGDSATILGLHRWLGTAAALLALAALVLFIRARAGDPKRLRTYRIATIAGAVLVGAAGHFGGSLTHGADFLNPWSYGAAPAPAGPGAAAIAFPADGKVVFATHVKPILDRSCVECHCAKKKKAELRLDTRELALEGGKSGPALVPGKSEEGTILKRLRGEGGQDWMPLNKPPLTEDEIRILKVWIDAGAEWPEAPLEAAKGS